MANLNLEAIDFKYLLLENYKKLGLSENDLAVLLMINHLLEQKNNFITADQLAVKMSMPIKDIDNILVSLLHRKFIEYDTSGDEVKTTLAPLNKKLYSELQRNILDEVNIANDKDKSDALQNIYQVFEKEFQRTLTPLEFSMINEWVNYGFSDQKIIDALHEAISKNKKSLRSVDKILLQWQTRDDREQEGHSAISDKWNKDIEETIRIAQAKWVNDDDEE